jgi:hypothetical protein
MGSRGISTARFVAVVELEGTVCELTGAGVKLTGVMGE